MGDSSTYSPRMHAAHAYTLTLQWESSHLGGLFGSSHRDIYSQGTVQGRIGDGT